MCSSDLPNSFTAKKASFSQEMKTSPISRWVSERCVAFRHDVMDSPTLPAEFDVCEALIVDPPWQNGFDEFNARAGLGPGRSYKAFLARVGEIVTSTTVPTYVVTGRHAAVKLPPGEVNLFLHLNDDSAVAVGYHVGDEAADDDVGGGALVLLGVVPGLLVLVCGTRPGGPSARFNLA